MTIRPTVLIAALASLAASPAAAQGAAEHFFQNLFGQAPVYVPQPSHRPASDPRYYSPSERDYGRRAAQPRVKVARLPVEQPAKWTRVSVVPQRTDTPETVDAPKMPERARPIGEVANPVPQLLSDKTLREGDVVVFPDGPRVFKGTPGDKHKITDFVRAADSSRGAAKHARKVLAALKISTNDAWSVEHVSSEGQKKLAQIGDVEGKGSAKKGRRR